MLLRICHNFSCLERIKDYRILQQHKPELCEKWKVKSLGIYGSYVRGEAGKNRELDRFVEFDDPKMGLQRLIASAKYHSDMLGV